GARRVTAPGASAGTTAYRCARGSGAAARNAPCGAVRAAPAGSRRRPDGGARRASGPCRASGSGCGTFAEDSTGGGAGSGVPGPPGLFLLLLVHDADQRRQADEERVELSGGHPGGPGVEPGVETGGQPGAEGAAGAGDAQEQDAPVGGVALALDEALGLQVGGDPADAALVEPEPLGERAGRGARRRRVRGGRTPGRG